MESSAADPLRRIVFISLPENLHRTIGSLTVDPSIRMPVELPPGESVEAIKDLSWEMIVAGMLKVLAYRPEHEHAAYFRRFILEVKPSIAEELSGTAIMKARNKDFDLAEEIFRALASLLPEDARNLVNLALAYEEHAEAYEQIGDERLRDEYVERAFEAYKSALRLEPDSTEANYNAAYFHLKQRNYGKAVGHFEAFVNRSDDSRRVERAKAIMKELKAQDLLDNLFKEAYDFIRLGKEREGIAKIKEFLQRHPNVWNAWFIYGWGLRRLGEYAEGREAFLKALKLGGTQADTYNELAICLMELGELAESRGQLMKAIKIEPENIKILSNLGIVSMKEHKPGEAIGFFRTVLAIEPADPIAKKYLELLTRDLPQSPSAN